MDGFPGPRRGDSGVDGAPPGGDPRVSVRLAPSSRPDGSTVLVGGLFVVLGVLLLRFRSNFFWAVERPGP